jgi:hypothetical protein
MRELNIKIAKHLGWVYITHLQLKEMKKSDKKLNKAFKPGWYYYLPIDIDKLIESALNYLIKALDKETLHYEISKETNFRNEFYMCIAKEEVTTGNTLYEVIYKILGKLL